MARACRKNRRVRFSTACQLVRDLQEAREDYRLKKLMDRMKRYDLLILDELGYVPFSKPGAELLFQVLAERHEQKSTIITSNLAFPNWTDVFEDATLTAALLDRITHHCHILEFNWTSIRLQESQQKQMTGIEEVTKSQSAKRNKDGRKTEQKVEDDTDK